MQKSLPTNTVPGAPTQVQSDATTKGFELKPGLNGGSSGPAPFGCDDAIEAGDNGDETDI